MRPWRTGHTCRQYQEHQCGERTHGGLVVSYLWVGAWQEACEVCVKVIEVDPYNVKALYRGGVASMMQV